MRSTSRRQPASDQRRAAFDSAPGLRRVLWSKQFYVRPRRLARRRSAVTPPPPRERHERPQLRVDASLSRDVISMPDKWEYPWFAAWDLAFHCIAFALIDPGLREAAAPAADARVVHAPQRADPGLRVDLRRRQSAGACVGRVPRLPDRTEKCRDAAIASFSSASSRSCCSTSPGGSTAKTPRATTSSRAAFSAWTISASSTALRSSRRGHLEQADGTSWMAVVLPEHARIALELAQENPVYEDMASSSSSISSTSRTP